MNLDLYGNPIHLTQTCIKCGETKHLSEFAVRARNKSGQPSEYRNDCRDCQKKQAKEVKNLKKDHPYPHHQEHCDSCKRHYKEIYGNNQYKKKKHWVLDHCHITGNYRGYICEYCNTALGRMQDNIEYLRNMVEYLEKNVQVESETK